MKLENLEVGQVYKSYRQLCEVLGEKISTGGSKIAQIKEWDRFFKYSKQGNKFIIEEILDVPIEKIENRGTKGIYTELIQLLIVDFLAQCKGHLSISKFNLITELGMTNKNFSKCKDNLKKLSLYTGINIENIYDFYNINNNNLKNVTETALISLMNKRVIMYSVIKKVKMLDSEYHKKATHSQIETIMRIEKQLLINFNYDDMSSIRASRDWINFKNERKISLAAETNIEYYYDAYEITINKEFLEHERKKLVNLILEKTKREDTKNELNELIRSNISKNAEKRQSDASNSKSHKTERMRRKSDYLSNTEELSNLLIKRSTPYLYSEVMSTTYILTDDVIAEIDALF